MASDNAAPRDNPAVLSNAITSYNGDAQAAIPLAQLVGNVARTADGIAWDLEGAYGYAADNGAPAIGTIDVPATARLRRVMVAANASAATTVAIGGGDTITISAGGSFDEQIPGVAVGADVVIGGGVPQGYYVSWVV